MKEAAAWLSGAVAALLLAVFIVGVGLRNEAQRRTEAAAGQLLGSPARCGRSPVSDRWLCVAGQRLASCAEGGPCELATCGPPGSLTHAVCGRGPR